LKEIMMEFSLARQGFYTEIQQSEDQIDLARAALWIAKEEYAQLELEEYLNALDVMAQEVEERLPSEPYPLRMIQTINHYLYEDLGFTGNQEDYYDPRNSYLNEVIDRRTGIPITLALLYLEIAKRIGFPMVGVGMPGHFLIRPIQPEMSVFVDPFHLGEVLFPEDCQNRLTQIYGNTLSWQPDFLESTGNAQFLVRILTNLKFIYLNRHDLERTLAAIDRILMLLPFAPLELRDRGLVLYQMGRWQLAQTDLEAYLTAFPSANDSPIIQQLLATIQEER
jgi:regulator of sirC expression with transglutaminase-like and TPR domain